MLIAVCSSFGCSMTLHLRLNDGRVLVVPWYPNAVSITPGHESPPSPSRRSRSSGVTVLDISSEMEPEAPPIFCITPVRDRLGVYQHLSEPTNLTDMLARQVLLQESLCFDDIDAVLNTLPAQVQSDRPIFQPLHGGATSPSPTSFASGAYIHGPHACLHSTMRQFPWLTQLLVCIVRTQVPDCFFSTVSIHRDCAARIHRDSHNHSCIPNYVTLDNRLGVALPITLPFVSFDPRLRHATLPWEGTRILIAFHIRSAWRLSSASLQSLRNAGFQVHVSDVRGDPYQ